MPFGCKSAPVIFGNILRKTFLPKYSAASRILLVALGIYGTALTQTPGTEDRAIAGRPGSAVCLEGDSRLDCGAQRGTREQSIIDLREFGCSLDGATDDTPCFRAALLAVGGTSSRIAVRGPRRAKLLFSSPVTVSQAVTLLGDGAGSSQTAGGTQLIYAPSRAGTTAITVTAYGAVLRDFELIQQNRQPNTNGIVLSTQDSQIQSVSVKAFTNDCIQIKALPAMSSIWNKLFSPVTVDCGNAGLHFIGNPTESKVANANTVFGGELRGAKYSVVFGANASENSLYGTDISAQDTTAVVMGEDKGVSRGNHLYNITEDSDRCQTAFIVNGSSGIFISGFVRAQVSKIVSQHGGAGWFFDTAENRMTTFGPTNLRIDSSGALGIGGALPIRNGIDLPLYGGINWDGSAHITMSKDGLMLRGRTNVEGPLSATHLTSVLNVVAFSATPIFDLSLGNVQKIMLSGNVRTSKLKNITTGEKTTFIICQDNMGGRTFNWPSELRAGMVIAGGRNACSVQEFVSDGVTLFASSKGVVNLSMLK